MDTDGGRAGDSRDYHIGMETRTLIANWATAARMTALQSDAR